MLLIFSDNVSRETQKVSSHTEYKKVFHVKHVKMCSKCSVKRDDSYETYIKITFHMQSIKGVSHEAYETALHMQHKMRRFA